MSRYNQISNDEIMKIYTDGASRNNPGKSSCAFLICNEDDEVVYDKSNFLGETTNNRAEYKAIINSLDKAISFSRGAVEVYSDSQLVVNQCKKVYRVKDPNLKKLYRQVISKINDFKKVKFFHLPREHKMIKKADQLCNECLDEHLGLND